MGSQNISDEAMDTAMKKIVEDTVGSIPEPPKKKHTVLKVFLLIIALLVVGAGTTYAVFANQYKEKFIEGTYINGIDAGNLTVAQVESKIQTIVENYDLTLTFRSGTTEKISGPEIGYAYVSDNGVANLLKEQNSFEWIRGKFGEKREYTVGEAFAFDSQKLKSALEALPEFQAANETKPTNAYMKYQDDGSFAIIAETQGNTLVEDKVLEAAGNAVSSSEKTLDLTSVDGAYETPVVFSTNQDMIDLVNNLNSFLATVITYDLPDGTKQVLDKKVLKDWISLQDNGYYYLNDEVISDNCNAYIQLMAKNVDEVHTTQNFHSTLRGDVTLSSEKYGHVIDQTQEAAALYQDVLNHTSAEREPAWSLNKTVQPNFGGTYVEVDLVNQHVYFYVNSVLYADTDCVSGLATDPERATPTGVFSVKTKETNRTLKGPLGDDGQPTYTSFVNYWMQFYQGCGLHDASWRSEFGGSIYKTSGSHGCVNLPYNAAQKIYEKVAVGTPVIVF